MTPYRAHSLGMIVTGAVLLTAGNLWAQRADLLPPLTRDKVVERAHKLVDRDNETAARLPEDRINPFDPTAGQQIETPVETTPQRVVPGDAQVLKAIAPQIQPTGAMVLGGEAYLLFGQKKFKVGDSMPIVFEGVTYNVLVTDIQTINFSIRLGESELVRPIKPVIRP